MGSTMQLLKNIHSIIDYALALLKLVQNREVGWRTLNRKTGKYEREQQPLFKKLKLLLLFNPITEWIDRTHLLRLWIHEKTIAAGQKEASKASAHQIKGFVDFYHINMEGFQPSNLSEFHIRRLLRPTACSREPPNICRARSEQGSRGCRFSSRRFPFCVSGAGSLDQ